LSVSVSIGAGYESTQRDQVTASHLCARFFEV